MMCKNKKHSKRRKKKKKFKTKDDDKTCCIKNFIDTPSTTRAGTCYSELSFFNCRTIMPKDKITYIYGWILTEAFFEKFGLSSKAKSVSRKVKILCVCENCITYNALKKSIKNRSGVIYIQVYQHLNYQYESTTAESQTNVINKASKPVSKLLCSFRKTIAIKKPVVRKDLKNTAIQCSDIDKSTSLQSNKENGETSEPKVKRNKMCGESNQAIFTKNSSNRVKRRHQKSKSKSLLKYVLKREALKSLKMSSWNNFYKNKIKDLQTKVKRMLNFKKRIWTPSKLETPKPILLNCDKLKTSNLKQLKHKTYKLEQNNNEISLCKRHLTLKQYSHKKNKLNTVKKHLNNSLFKRPIILKKLGQFYVKKDASISTAFKEPFIKLPVQSHSKLFNKLQAFLQQIP